MKIKRCPFCGQDARIFKIPQNTTNELSMHPNWMWQHPGMYVIGCDTPMCYGNINNVAMCFFNDFIAVEAWNRRADDD